MNSFFQSSMSALVGVLLVITVALLPRPGLAQHSAVEAFEAQLLSPASSGQPSNMGTVHAALANGELKLIVGYRQVSPNEDIPVGSHLYRGNPLSGGTYVRDLALALGPNGGFETTIQTTPSLEADLRAGLLYVQVRTELLTPPETINGVLLATSSNDYYETRLTHFLQGYPVARGGIRAFATEQGLRLVGYFNALGSNWTRISLYRGEAGSPGDFFAWLWNTNESALYAGFDQVVPMPAIDWQADLEDGRISIIVETSRASDWLRGRLLTRTNEAPPASQMLQPTNGSVVVIGGAADADPLPPDFYLGSVTLDKVNDPDGDPVNYFWQLSTRPGFQNDQYLSTIDLGIDNTVLRLSVAHAAAIFDALAANEPGGVPFQTPVTVFHRVVTSDGSRYTVGPATETTFVRGTVTSHDPDAEVPLDLRLRGNHPNPFSATTTVAFDLPSTADIRVDVYDLLGRNVASVEAGQMSGGVLGEVEVDGTALPNGTYLYRVTARGSKGVSVATGSMILVK